MPFSLAEPAARRCCAINPILSTSISSQLLISALSALSALPQAQAATKGGWRSRGPLVIGNVKF